MAGSFNHIIGKDGEFRFDSIENLGDAHEMAEEFYACMMYLHDNDWNKINKTLKTLNFPTVDLSKKE